MQAPGPTGPQEDEICFKDNTAYFGHNINNPATTRTPLSASSFARIGMEEEADTISGLWTRSFEGATSRAVWMVKSIPYNSMGMCIKTTITIMHLDPWIAPSMSTHPIGSLLFTIQ